MVEGADGGHEGVGQAGGAEAEEGEGGEGDVEHEAGQGGGGEEDARSRGCCLPEGGSTGCHHVVPPYSTHQVKEPPAYLLLKHLGCRVRRCQKWFCPQEFSAPKNS